MSPLESDTSRANSSSVPWLTLCVGAILGGVLAQGAIGGVLGALVAVFGAWLLRRDWPAGIRWASAMLTWGLGFAALWLGTGFVNAVRGLLRAMG
jgi:hypothetical protein